MYLIISCAVKLSDSLLGSGHLWKWSVQDTVKGDLIVWSATHFPLGTSALIFSFHTYLISHMLQNLLTGVSTFCLLNMTILSTDLDFFIPRRLLPESVMFTFQ